MKTDKWVLIVEDEKDVAELIAERLESFEGINLVKAYDGLEAYRRAREQKFDLICTDFRMPNLNGASFVKYIRENAYNISAPIIVITGYVEEAQQKFEKMEIDDIEYMEKPIDYKRLLELAEKFLYKKDLDNLEEIDDLTLDLWFVDPIIEATIDTFKTMVMSSEVKSGNVELVKKGEDAYVDITGSLPIVSKTFNGSLSLSFSEETYLKVVNKMLDKNFKKIDISNEDVVGELANIIFGQAKVLLEKRNYKFQHSMPTIIKGKGHSLSVGCNNNLMSIPFTSEEGPFRIYIGL